MGYMHKRALLRHTFGVLSFFIAVTLIVPVNMILSADVLGRSVVAVPTASAQETSGVSISEIAWMGGEDAKDEWVELYNNGTSTVSLSGWTLNAEDGTPSITIESAICTSMDIAAGGYFLLERADDDSAPGASADCEYGNNGSSWALSNEGEVLVLRNASGTEEDTVDASNGWPAGDNETKETMQDCGEGWITAEGTPKEGCGEDLNPPPDVLPELPQFPVCGNFEVEEGEMCDDGNTSDGDGCSSQCQLEVFQCEDIDEGEGWYGEYFNYLSAHEDMQLPGEEWGVDHGDPFSDEGAWQADWYDEEYFRFSRVDSEINFPHPFFPFDIAPEELTLGGAQGEHEYHFGVHWRALVTTDVPGVYNVTLRSDDDSWVYVDGDLVGGKPGVHPANPVNTEIIALNLTGSNIINVFFAERHTSHSQVFFIFEDDRDLTITPLPEECQSSIEVCKLEDLLGDGETEDDIPVSRWGIGLIDKNYPTEEIETEILQLSLVGGEPVLTGDNGCVLFNDLLPGPYRVIEEARKDWVFSWGIPGFSIGNIFGGLGIPPTATTTGGDSFFDIFVDIDLGYDEKAEITLGNFNAKYCGDGVVNQEWEQCDSTEECTDQCQLEDSQMCSDLVLAQVNIDEETLSNEGDGDVEPYVFVGSILNKLPNGTWFPLYWSGVFFTDPDISVYEDVKGLAVERQEGALRTVLHGAQDTEDKEHTRGTVEFYNATVDSVISDDANGLGPSNKLEKGFDGEMEVSPGQDEVSTTTDPSVVSFWMTVNTADDGFIVDWTIIEDCEGICGVKFNDENANGEWDEEELTLPEWEISLYEKNQCIYEDEWADTVISTSQGLRKNGSAVLAERSDQSKALGVAEGDDTLNFYSLGFGGEMVLAFTNIIEDEPGDDIEVTETTFGSLSCEEYPERVHVYASQTGADGSWKDLGSGCLDSTFDLATGGLDWAFFIKLVDETNPNDFEIPTADGYDVDGVRAIHCRELTPIEQQYTTEEGYCFVEISEGEYFVTEEQKDGWYNTTPIGVQTFFEGGEKTTINFGNARFGRIVGFKFFDRNENGRKDEGEEGLPGWTIELYGDPMGSDPIATTSTNGVGRYRFMDLPPGVYHVKEVLQDGWTQTKPADPDFYTVELGLGEILKRNFGNFASAGALHGMKYLDNNGDGIKDEEEEGLPDWEIWIYRAPNMPLVIEDWIDAPDHEPFATTTTCGGEVPCMEGMGVGSYWFEDLPPGVYQVFEVLKDGWEQTGPRFAEDITNGTNGANVLPPELIPGAPLSILAPSPSPGDPGYDWYRTKLAENPTMIKLVAAWALCIVTELGGHQCAEDFVDALENIRYYSVLIGPGDEIENADFGNRREVPLEISGEETSEPEETDVTVYWTTNKQATSRVVYGTTSVSVLGSPPNYGYPYSTIEDPAKVTNHEVNITGLTPGTTYYWRAISSASPETVGDEKSFSTKTEENGDNGDNGGGDVTSTGGGGGGIISGPLSYGGQGGGGGGTPVSTGGFTPVEPVPTASGVGSSIAKATNGIAPSEPGPADSTPSETEGPPKEIAMDEERDINQLAQLGFLGFVYECSIWHTLLALVVIVAISLYIYKRHNNTWGSILVLILGAIAFWILGSYNCTSLLAILAILAALLIGWDLRQRKLKGDSSDNSPMQTPFDE